MCCFSKMPAGAPRLGPGDNIPSRGLGILSPFWIIAKRYLFSIKSIRRSDDCFADSFRLESECLCGFHRAGILCVMRPDSRFAL